MGSYDEVQIHGHPPRIGSRRTDNLDSTKPLGVVGFQTDDIFILASGDFATVNEANHCKIKSPPFTASLKDIQNENRKQRKALMNIMIIRSG